MGWHPSGRHPADVIGQAQQPMSREVALRAAIHPVSAARSPGMARSRSCHARLSARLRGRAARAGIALRDRDEHGIRLHRLRRSLGKLLTLRAHYGWQVRAIGAQEAMLRSGRLGLPWVGNPVAWVRPIADPNRMVPVAIGTDHSVNLARNTYLAAKMLTGVRVAVGVRAMSKFTGIVSPGR
jgi:hypothetical protein